VYGPGASVQSVIAGVEPLTERELEVLRLLAAGRSNQGIAAELIVAVGTVKRHVSNIMDKLQAESRLEAVARARALGLL
jgi:LuxR family maltose regulon positive regulatory protein